MKHLLLTMGLVEWHDYFAAMAGCAATLTGLLFVSVSIGLKTILEYPMLPSVAQRSLLLLVLVLLVTGFGLLPAQSVALVGCELLGIGLLSWGLINWLSLRIWRQSPAERRFWPAMLLPQLATLPYVIGGIWLLAAGTAGLYWLAAAVAFSFCQASIDAWVLLLEIHR